MTFFYLTKVRDPVRVYDSVAIEINIPMRIIVTNTTTCLMRDAIFAFAISLNSNSFIMAVGS